MKGKLIPSIAGLSLALGLSVANAGQVPGPQGLANGATNAQPAPAAQSSASTDAFAAVLGSAHYVPMSDRELSRVNGKQIVESVVTAVGDALNLPPLPEPLASIEAAILEALP